MAGKVSAVAKFVSHKVSKVVWEPPRPQTLQPPAVFATGSWDDEDNRLSIWSAGESDYQESASIADEPRYFDSEPELICSTQHSGNVTDILFLSNNALLASSSSGGVTLYKFDNERQMISADYAWPKLHSLTAAPQCPCTALASQNNEFVSVGEDGRLNVVSLDRGVLQVQTVGIADSCSLNDVCYIQQQTIAVVNSIGQFKVWDVRLRPDRPSKVLILSGSRVPLHCIAQHPTQPHILATGGQDGMLYVWDMRKDKLPVTILKAHTSSMWDVKFHESHPNHLFTCSNDGSLWHWDNSASCAIGAQAATHGLFGKGHANDHAAEQTCDWTMTSERHLDITDLLDDANVMSVNSFDTTGTSLICGTDSEQLILMRNLAVF
jgi:nuclear pore complex protein Nup43